MFITIPKVFASMGMGTFVGIMFFLLVLCAALTKAEESGAATGSDAYKQAVIDAIRTEGPSVIGVTSATGYTFDDSNNPIKDAVIMELVKGREVFKDIY